ncbi:uncharacterized protein G2W53_042418 [Senna tora]|uniref:Uncharacterized protein n=1 Tax=Senna tora TaxID=362788 RepID=A0A834SGY1_9FABA|nr:uncharacterized protein G2W53_042418 [Senna tora]
MEQRFAAIATARLASTRGWYGVAARRAATADWFTVLLSRVQRRPEAVVVGEWLEAREKGSEYGSIDFNDYKPKVAEAHPRKFT